MATEKSLDKAKEIILGHPHPEDCKMNDGPGSERIKREGYGCNCLMWSLVDDIADALDAAKGLSE